jgi:hypothetical protein
MIALILFHVKRSSACVSPFLLCLPTPFRTAFPARSASNVPREASCQLQSPSMAFPACVGLRSSIARLHFALECSRSQAPSQVIVLSLRNAPPRKCLLRTKQVLLAANTFFDFRKLRYKHLCAHSCRWYEWLLLCIHCYQCLMWMLTINECVVHTSWFSMTFSVKLCMQAFRRTIKVIKALFHASMSQYFMTFPCVTEAHYVSISEVMSI